MRNTLYSDILFPEMTRYSAWRRSKSTRMIDRALPSRFTVVASLSARKKRSILWRRGHARYTTRKYRLLNVVAESTGYRERKRGHGRRVRREGTADRAPVDT